MFDGKKFEPIKSDYAIELEFIRSNYPKLLNSYKEGEGSSKQLNNLFLDAIWLQEFDNKKDFLLRCTGLKKVETDDNEKFFLKSSVLEKVKTELSTKLHTIILLREKILDGGEGKEEFKLNLDMYLNPIYDECKKKKVSFLEKNAKEELRKINSMFKKAIEELEAKESIPSKLKTCKINQVTIDIDNLILRACFKKIEELDGQAASLISSFNFYLKIFSLVSLDERESYIENNYRVFLKKVRPDNSELEEENLVKIKDLYSNEITTIIQAINKTIQSQNIKFKKFKTSSKINYFLIESIDKFDDLNNLEKFLNDRNEVINKWTKNLMKEKHLEFEGAKLSLIDISKESYENLLKKYEKDRDELKRNLGKVPDEFMRNIFQAEFYQRSFESFNEQGFKLLEQKFNYLKVGQESN